MQLYGLLRFLYRTVEIGLAKIAACLVANGIERYHLREIILVAALFGQRSVYKCLASVIISIVSGVERMPPTALAGVLLRGTTRHHKQNRGG